MVIKNEAGFSLIEIVCTLVIASIMTAYCVTRFSNDNLRLKTEAQILKSHIRYARQLAIANDISGWQIDISGDRYTLNRSCCNSPGNIEEIFLPGENSSTRKPEGNILFSLAAPAATNCISFDKWGSLTTGAGDYTVVVKDTATGEETRFKVLGTTGAIDETV